MTTAKVATRWRRAQFSLRTLLVLMFGTAVSCALIAARFRAKQREAVVVKKLTDASVYIVYDWQEKKRKEPYGPSWLRTILGDNFFSEVYRAAVPGPNHGDDVLKDLAELPSLKQLYLNAPRVTAAGFAHLARLRQLENVSFSGKHIDDKRVLHLAPLDKMTSFIIQDTSVTDAGLAPVRHWPRLRTFWVERTPITDVTLSYLPGKRELRWIELKQEPITDAGVAYLEGLTSLKMLGLDGTRVSDAGLKHLADLTNLEYLDLSDSQVSDAGMIHLAKLSKLKSLIMARTDVHGVGLNRIGGLSTLETLTMSGNTIDDLGLEQIGRLNRLKALSIDGPFGGRYGGSPNMVLTDRGLLALTKLKGLERLSIARTGVGDGGVEYLGQIASLKSLQLPETNVSPKGLLRLKGLLPKTQILPAPPSGPAAGAVGTAAAGTAAAERGLTKGKRAARDGAN